MSQKGLPTGRGLLSSQAPALPEQHAMSGNDVIGRRSRIACAMVQRSRAVEPQEANRRSIGGSLLGAACGPGQGPFKAFVFGHMGAQEAHPNDMWVPSAPIGEAGRRGPLGHTACTPMAFPRPTQGPGRPSLGARSVPERPPRPFGPLRAQRR